MFDQDVVVVLYPEQKANTKCLSFKTLSDKLEDYHYYWYIFFLLNRVEQI